MSVERADLPILEGELASARLDHVLHFGDAWTPCLRTQIEEAFERELSVQMLRFASLVERKFFSG